MECPICRRAMPEDAALCGACERALSLLAITAAAQEEQRRQQKDEPKNPPKHDFQDERGHKKGRRSMLALAAAGTILVSFVAILAGSRWGTIGAATSSPLIHAGADSPQYAPQPADERENASLLLLAAASEEVGLSERMIVNFYTWEPRPDGTICAHFNLLRDETLYQTLLRQGEAFFLATEEPDDFGISLYSLSWNKDPVFRPSRIAASSTRVSVGSDSFMPNLLIDGDRTTAWAAAEGAAGAAHNLEFVLDGERSVTGFVLVNGWCKDLETMRCNDRIKTLRIEIGDFTWETELADLADTGTLAVDQCATWGYVVKTDRIHLTVTSVYRGEQPGGSVCISEIGFF